MTTVHQQKANLSDIGGLILSSLPDQGCVEVQRDVPGKEHSWHTHKVDETIVVLNGSLRFYHEKGERICFPGDVISLPAHTPHGSQALNDGAVYLIAFHAMKV